MWWSISGILLQLGAGILLAVPFIFPGELQRFDEGWHAGRGRRWVLVAILVIMGIIIFAFFTVTNFLNNTDINTWYEKLLGAAAASVLTSLVWWLVLNLLRRRRLKKISKLFRGGEIPENLRLEELVKANRRTALAGVIGLAVFTLVFVAVQMTYFENTWVLASVIMLWIFSATTLLISLLFMIINRLINVLGSRMRKPFWTLLIVVFALGSAFQILGEIYR